VDAGVDLRLLSAARTWFAEAEALGWGDWDYSAVLAHIIRAT
jgi:3-hydroxyisobutyrate dehydrogenase-like beta-hydroxyacid dehydrogenase